MPYLVIGIVALLVAFLASGYVKAPPDQAYIITGLKKRILIGRAGIKVPFLERLDKLDLRTLSVDVKTNSPVPTAEFINVTVDSIVKIKVSNKPELLSIAAENFLNKNVEYIVASVQDVLEGNMREIVGQMKLSAMVSDRKLFAEKVQENAAPDMARMGLEIISFNVQNFIDRNGVIEDLGIDNITQIKKSAAIAKAEGERDIKVAQAQADKDANDARVKADMEIAIKKNDLSIKESELRTEADLKKAQADAAYKIQSEYERRNIETTAVEADIARVEKETELKAQEAIVAEKELEAQIRKQSDADRYAREQKAQADLFERQKEAEAARYEAEQNALALKAKAEADRYAKEMEAEGIRNVGLAEAEAIRAKAIAEAEGIDKKAEAMAKMQEAAVLEMYFKALPEIVKNAATPLENVDKITMYGDGNSSKLVKDIIATTTQVTDGLKEASGVDLKELLTRFTEKKDPVEE